jgi:hypothetical protein
MLKTYVIDIPGAVSGVSLGARALEDVENGLEEEAIDFRYDDGNGFGVIVDIPRWVLVDASVGTYVRATRTTAEDDDDEGSWLIAEKAGRNDMVG